MRVTFWGRLDGLSGRVVRIDLPLSIDLRFAVSSIPFPTFLTRRTPKGAACDGLCIDAGWMWFHVGVSRWRFH